MEWYMWVTAAIAALFAIGVVFGEPTKQVGRKSTRAEPASFEDQTRRIIRESLDIAATTKRRVTAENRLGDVHRLLDELHCQGFTDYEDMASRSAANNLQSGLDARFPKQNSAVQIAEYYAQTERRELNAIDAIFGRDEDFYLAAELNRQATAHGDEGRMDEAISCLFEARALDNLHIGHPAGGMRYPLYLQKGGRGAEAKLEMMRLIGLVPQYVERTRFSDAPAKKSDKEFDEALQYADLYDKLRLILKREKEMAASEACLKVALAWRARANAFRDRTLLKKRIIIPKRPAVFEC